ncbi:hypothetical protein ACFLYT_01725, partial [Nanoarchaeota archaeon]
MAAIKEVLEETLQVIILLRSVKKSYSFVTTGDVANINESEQRKERGHIKDKLEEIEKRLKKVDNAVNKEQLRNNTALKESLEKLLGNKLRSGIVLRMAEMMPVVSGGIHPDKWTRETLKFLREIIQKISYLGVELSEGYFEKLLNSSPDGKAQIGRDTWNLIDRHIRNAKGVIGQGVDRVTATYRGTYEKTMPELYDKDAKGNVVYLICVEKLLIFFLKQLEILKKEGWTVSETDLIKETEKLQKETLNEIKKFKGYNEKLFPVLKRLEDECEKKVDESDLQGVIAIKAGIEMLKVSAEKEYKEHFDIADKFKKEVAELLKKSSGEAFKGNEELDKAKEKLEKFVRDKGAFHAYVIDKSQLTDMINEVKNAMRKNDPSKKLFPVRARAGVNIPYEEASKIFKSMEIIALENQGEHLDLRSVKEVWDWLQKKFPNEKYSYKRQAQLFYEKWVLMQKTTDVKDKAKVLLIFLEIMQIIIGAIS